MATEPALRRTLLAAAAGGVVTVTVAAVPGLRLAYRSLEGHLVLETAMAMVGALLALLLYGRFRRSAALQDLLIAVALAVMAVAALFLATLPVVAGAGAGSAIATWAPVLVRLVAAVLLLAGALAGRRVVPAGAHVTRDVLAVVALLVVVTVAVQGLAALLPAAVTTFPPPEQSGRPRLEGHPVVLAAQAASLVCFAGACVALTRQAAASRDDLIGWLAAACALGAWARVSYLLYPSLYSAWLYTGDLLRAGFYALLVVGAVREVRLYWAATAQAAVAAERARLARDLHDGAVQELGWVLRELSGPLPDAAAAARVRSAAERALAEARRAVSALAAPVDQSLPDAVRAAVEEVADRYDVTVRVLPADPGDGSADRPDVGAVDAVDRRARPLDTGQREALVRIAREAVWNAARHAGTGTVTVVLGSRLLRVEDDGAGFDPAGVPEGRFGLISMRDRAEGMGGQLAVHSARGAGTRVEVRW